MSNSEDKGVQTRQLIPAGRTNLETICESGFERRLIGILIVMAIWIAFLAIDNHLPNATIYTFMVWLTVLAYPLLILVTAGILRPSAFFRRWPPRHIGLLRWAPVLAAALTLGWVVAIPQFVAPGRAVTDDVTPSIICAAQDTLRGANPYLTNDVSCLNRLGANVGLATPLESGTFAHLHTYPSPSQLNMTLSSSLRNRSFPNFGYPPLSFVAMLPVAFGGRSSWVIWTLLLAALWVALMVRLAPRRKSTIAAILLVQMGAGSVLAAASQGDAEFAAFALCALGLACYDRTRLSSVLLSCAACFNLLMLIPLFGSWLLAARVGGIRRRFLWSGGTLLVGIGPWLLVYHGAAQAMLNLITQPVFNFGDGIVALFGAGNISPDWHPIFLAAFASLFALCSWVAWRFPRYAYSAPALLLALLWISWRSDANYLAQPFLLALGMIIGIERMREPCPRHLSVKIL